MAARTPAAAMSSSIRDASHVGSGLSSPGEWAAIVSHQNSYDLQSSWKVIQRGHGGAPLLGPLMFRWTTCVRLDHLNAVGPPGSRNTVVQRNASGPTARKWSNRAGRVTTCETPSHHAGRAVGAERGAPEPPPLHPVRPRRPARRSRRARLPPARPEATRAGHHDRPRAPAPLTTPRITPGERTQNHSPNSLHNIVSRKYDRTSAK